MYSGRRGGVRERSEYGADLVRRVAFRRDPVGTGDHAVDLPCCHQRPAAESAITRAGSTRSRAPRRSTAHPEQRTGLVDPDVLEQPCSHAVSSAPTALRSPRSRARPRCSALSARVRVQAAPRRARPSACSARLRPSGSAERVGRRVVAHLVERPGKVDGRRSRLAQHAIGHVQVSSVSGRKRDAVRRSYADRRCATAPPSCGLRRATDAAVRHRTSTSSSEGGAGRGRRPVVFSRRIRSGSSTRVDRNVGRRRAPQRLPRHRDGEVWRTRRTSTSPDRSAGGCRRSGREASSAKFV